MTGTTYDDHRHPIARHERRDRFAGGAVLAALGALALLVSGGEPERSAADGPAASQVSEDWHGNVRRSHWTP